MVPGARMPAASAVPTTRPFRGASGEESLQNEQGPVDHEQVVRFGAPPCIWRVAADGTWTIRPK